MITLAIILAAIVLLSLLRVGVKLVYDADGFTASARFGPFSRKVFPQKISTEKAKAKAEKKKKQKEAKKARKAKKAKKEVEPKAEKEKPGSFKMFKSMLPIGMKALGRLRRRLLIKTLTVNLVAANEDPSKTAMMFGAANAAFGTFMPLLERAFRIRRRDLRTSADFNSHEMQIYLKAVLSLSIWEVFYIAVALLPMIGIVSGKQGREKQGLRSG